MLFATESLRIDSFWRQCEETTDIMPEIPEKFRRCRCPTLAHLIDGYTIRCKMNKIDVSV